MGPGMRSPASAQPPPTTRRARLPPCVFHIVIIYGQVKCPSSSPFFSTSCKAGEGRRQSKPGCSGRTWRAFGAGRDPLHPPLLTHLPFRLTLKSGGWLGFPAMCSSQAEGCVFQNKGRHTGLAGRGDCERVQHLGRGRREVSSGV